MTNFAISLTLDFSNEKFNVTELSNIPSLAFARCVKYVLDVHDGSISVIPVIYGNGPAQPDVWYRPGESLDFLDNPTNELLCVSLPEVDINLKLTAAAKQVLFPPKEIQQAPVAPAVKPVEVAYEEDEDEDEDDIAHIAVDTEYNNELPVDIKDLDILPTDPNDDGQFDDETSARDKAYAQAEHFEEEDEEDEDKEEIIEYEEPQLGPVEDINQENLRTVTVAPKGAISRNGGSLATAHLRPKSSPKPYKGTPKEVAAYLRKRAQVGDRQEVIEICRRLDISQATIDGLADDLALRAKALITISNMENKNT